jgi:predicted enzyme involved in methoxymalonyl-ACP biosynthesis
MDLSSDLYKFHPEYVFVSMTVPKLIKKFYGTEGLRRPLFSSEQADKICALLAQLNDNTKGVKIILGNFMEINDSVFGQYANKAPASFLYQVRRLNGQLMTLAERTKNLFICDVAALTAEFGQNASVNNRNRIEADMAFSLDFLPCLAKAVADIIQAVSGAGKKCPGA